MAAWQDSVKVAEFVYDGDGKRVAAIEGGVTTVYIGNYYEYVDDNDLETGVGTLNNGVSCQDSATGSGYLMYSATDVYQRFGSDAPPANNAAHFICVKYDNGQWQFDNDSSYHAFDPVESHWQEVEGPPVAEQLLLDLSADPVLIDTVTTLVGCHHTPQGVDSPEFRILWDADALVNFAESLPGKPADQIDAILNRHMVTEAGYRKARTVFTETPESRSLP